MSETVTRRGITPARSLAAIEKLRKVTEASDFDKLPAKTKTDIRKAIELVERSVPVISEYVEARKAS